MKITMTSDQVQAALVAVLQAHNMHDKALHASDRELSQVVYYQRQLAQCRELEKIFRRALCIDASVEAGQ